VSSARPRLAPIQHASAGGKIAAKIAAIDHLPKGIPLKTTVLTLTLMTAITLGLSACSKNDTPPTPAATAAPVISASSYDTVAATGKGFTVGALMSAQPVYVLFDPQCGHCGHLWMASLALHNKVKFTWIPIAFNSGKSLAQAAALLTAGDPAQAMTAHEASLLKGSGGMTASSSIAPEVEQAIKANTQLLTSLGVDAVPFILAKNRRTGEIVSHNGAMDTAPLAQLLGVDAQ